ncbi:MAG: hypothetical protein L3J35_00155 [Bacteroidales bacterium]|nr:hypothetical protein [Bacteroidales bacterium]
MNRLNLIIAFSFLFFFGEITAQDVVKDENKKEITIGVEIRPRTEYYHGYKTPVTEFLIQDYYKTPPSLYTSQRSRLNLNYKANKVKFGMVLQDVRTWGSQKQLVANEANSVSVHQAWGEVFFTKEFSLKAGRMELVYDDHRILGNVGWAQQARSHDLALFKYEGNFKAHLGIAFHGGPFADANGNVIINDAYKAMQFLWINGKSGDFGYSILALNNGKTENGVWADFSDPTDPTFTGVAEGNAYSQIAGGRFTYKLGALSFAVNTYYQTGKKAANWVDAKSLPTGVVAADLGLADKAGQGQKISAYNIAFDAMYKVSDNFKAGLGFEMLSGNDFTDANRTDDNAFAPLYGTNHKFNGWMDYFYVGNHGSNVGLQDFNAKFIYKKDKFFVKLIPHYFLPAGKGTYVDKDGATQNLGALGTEIDLWAGYHIVPKVASIQFGYSQMFATESMYGLKGVTITDNNDIGTNNWAWIMLSVKPNWTFKK